jgi:hypothetical protein
MGVSLYSQAIELIEQYWLCELYLCLCVGVCSDSWLLANAGAPAKLDIKRFLVPHQVAPRQGPRNNPSQLSAQQRYRRLKASATGPISI